MVYHISSLLRVAPRASCPPAAGTQGPRHGWRTPGTRAGIHGTVEPCLSMIQQCCFWYETNTKLPSYYTSNMLGLRAPWQAGKPFGWRHPEHLGRNMLGPRPFEARRRCRGSLSLRDTMAEVHTLLENHGWQLRARSSLVFERAEGLLDRLRTCSFQTSYDQELGDESVGWRRRRAWR